ncbi:hypothetical protein CJA_2711 [Cellvibrio japonicus Ueda107]|uniref:Uncharacterized protein n=1 Tax=Cellvibrio japonicus (strain Ueda107) TaxID=498211 RepID=B3PBE4_CELJU|nr:hypothetical protein CJA_2711 [Cellvibrio japonicus Ueda107]
MPLFLSVQALLPMQQQSFWRLLQKETALYKQAFDIRSPQQHVTARST